MKLTTFFKTTNLENSLLFGYYGGGNFGDELLLEVLANLLVQNHVQNLTITYQNPSHYQKYHHDFGYPLIEVRSKLALIKAILKNKNIIIGGGGLWGVDMNLNTFLLSITLWISRWVLGKKIYLIGVGYYNSTNRMGRMGAWFAGKAATTIVARDNETFQNFSKISSQTQLDTDIAWYIDDLQLDSYQQEVNAIENKLPPKEKTLCIALRRVQAKHKASDFTHFNQEIASFLATNTNKPILIALLESKEKSPVEYALAYEWQRQYSNIRVLDFPHNPLALFLYFRKHAKQLALIAPQFHIIITAYLTHVAFMPMVYDNKVDALLERIGTNQASRISIKQVDQANIQIFADKFFGGTK